MDLKFQIGKSGLTQGVLEALRKGSENYKSIRISVLKSSGRDRNSIKELADSLISGLNYEKYSYTYKVIGFTIILKRHLTKSLKTPQSKVYKPIK